MSIEGLAKVVVTGYGVHSAVERIDDIVASAERGDHLTRLLTLSSDAGGISCVGVSSGVSPPLPYLTQRKWLKYMGPQTQLAVWAAGKALEHAGLMGDANAAHRAKMGLLLATGPIDFDLSDVLPSIVAARGTDEQLDFEALGIAGLRASSPMMPFHTLLNMPIGLVSMIFGIKGQNAIYYPDAEQALFAFAAASRAIKQGRLSMALVGGTAHLLSLMPIVSYQRRGLLAVTPEATCAFRSGHCGFGLTNAASLLVLESEAHARARGAKIYGEIEVDPSALSTKELVEKRAERSKVTLSIVSGTYTEAQDADVTSVSLPFDCIGFDAVTGYAGPAALALNLSIACRLLEEPSIYRDGRWEPPTSHPRTVEVLMANHQLAELHWGRVRLGVAS